MSRLRFVLALALLASDPASPPADAGPPDAGPIGDPLGWSTAEPGPFATGYRTWQRTYRPPGQSEDRTIRIHVWYPTFDRSGPPPTYVTYRDLRAYTDAAPAAPAHASGRYPLHVFSHGHQGFAGSSHPLHRFMASHGWVTVAPDHTGNTLVDNVDPRPIALYYERALDVAEAIDALDELEPADPLAGTIDTARVILTGHSFGAHTVWSSAGGTFDLDAIMAGTCAEVPCTPAELDVFRGGLVDPRVVAASPMAGVISTGFFGDAGHASVTIPILAQSGGADPIGADAQFARVTGIDFTWADVAGACHQFWALGCPGDPDGEQERIAGRLVLALGRAHVLGDNDPETLGILDGSVSVSDRVVVRVAE